MQVQIEDLSPVEKKLAVEIPWTTVQQKLDRAFKSLGTQVVLNGFRKGKVPRAVLEQRFGQHVRNEVAKELVQESFLSVAEEHKIDPVAEPVIEEAVLKQGEPFRWAARVEVRGPVDLKEWQGLPGSRRKVLVADDEVERALEQKRIQHVELRPITDREVTSDKDVLQFHAVGKVTGPAGEFPIDRELQIDLSDAKTEPLPGMAAALVGLPLGAKDHELALTMPAEHAQKEIAGATANLKVTFKEAREKLLPALDDEFAKDTGEAETLADLRAKLRADLEKQQAARADRELRDGLLKELVKRNPFAVAPALVERGVDSQMQRARLSFAMQGIDLLKSGIDLKEMRERLKGSAEEEVRGQLLLGALGDRENLEVSPAELEAKVTELAAAQGKPVHRYKAELDKQGALDSLRFRIRQEKALDLVQARATITEAEPAPSDEAANAGEETP
jgi:trigger factor